MAIYISTPLYISIIIGIQVRLLSGLRFNQKDILKSLLDTLEYLRVFRSDVFASGLKLFNRLANTMLEM